MIVGNWYGKPRKKEKHSFNLPSIIIEHVKLGSDRTYRLYNVRNKVEYKPDFYEGKYLKRGGKFCLIFKWEAPNIPYNRPFFRISSHWLDDNREWSRSYCVGRMGVFVSLKRVWTGAGGLNVSPDFTQPTDIMNLAVDTHIMLRELKLLPAVKQSGFMSPDAYVLLAKAKLYTVHGHVHSMK